MIELELLGANGDQLVMADAEGQRYTLLVDEAVRTAVRRARPAAMDTGPQLPATQATLPPREIQALMRAGATAAEVASSTGMDMEHIQRFEGPVLAERGWAVEQARACHIGWESDSPVLGDLVIDRLATRGVEPSSLRWDATRQGRDPWRIELRFVQGAEEKEAAWELDLTARSVTALDDEARWLTEAGTHSAQVFDQDSTARSAVARTRVVPPPVSSPVSPIFDDEPSRPAAPLPSGDGHPMGPTESLLADLASSRGQRVPIDMSEFADAEPGATGAQPSLGGAGATGAAGVGSAAGGGAGANNATGAQPSLGATGAQRALGRTGSQPAIGSATGAHPVIGGTEAEIVPLSARRRKNTGNHPAGSRLSEPSIPSAAGPATATNGIPRADEAMTGEQEGLYDQALRATRGEDETGSQEELPQMPEGGKPKPRKKSRRSVPSWDDIMFGPKPE